MKKLLSSGLVIGAMVSLVGCGGGSSNDTPTTPTASTDTGYFVDTYVAGLDYTCSSGKTDKTTAEGQYSCNAGDTVQFSVGGFNLGGEVAASSGIVSPLTLWPDSTTNSDPAYNIVQLLLSIDTNTTDDIITVADINLSGLPFEINSTNFDNDMDTALIAAGIPTGISVSNGEAATHLDQSEVLFFMAGNSFYLFDEGMERLDISADGTGVTITDLVNGGSEPIAISIEGDTITAADGTTVKVYLQESLISFDNAIIVDVNESGVVTEERWYLDQEDRLRGLLSSATWESTDVTLTFDENVTSVSILDAGATDPFTDTVTLNGMELTHSEGTDVIVIVNPEMIIFNPGTQDEETFTLVIP